MQRKDIDQLEFDDLHAAMTDTIVDHGAAITTIVGTHALFGGLILISAAGRCAVLGNDVRLILGQDDTIEGDMDNTAIVRAAESLPATGG